MQSTCFDGAVLKYSLGDFKGAKKELVKLQKENQENSEYYYLLGLVLHKLGNTSESIPIFTKCINLKPNLHFTAYGYFRRGISYLDVGSFKNSEHDFKHSIQLFPDFENFIPYAHLYLGISKIYLGDFDIAIIDLNMAINLTEKNPKPYIWRAYCSLMLNDKNSSCKDLQKALLLGADGVTELLLKNCN